MEFGNAQQRINAAARLLACGAPKLARLGAGQVDPRLIPREFT